ncbi:hypothetical protein [Cellulomonas sp. 73-92]|uniref:hypothetical protein n=1 Tax=Cellulomonas sp. 73-92 TaxID=1895740 RepID=UPI0025BAD050|nr:hypothetical protein [Cellulomonas sp. 73-92]
MLTSSVRVWCVVSEPAQQAEADVLALEIGRIVVRAVWVDEVCADLAVEFQRAIGAVDRTAVTGQSGATLATALRRAGAATWASEYAALYRRRNEVIHGRWSADADHRQVVRPVQGGAHAGAFAVTTWDRDFLQQLARDLDDLFVRARLELFTRRDIVHWLTPDRPYQ